MRTSRPHALTALAASVVLAGCLTFGAVKGPPKGTYRERLFGFAGLLRMEDRRAYDSLLAGRTAASPDSWLRAKTALAVSRLKDPDASVYLPVLLKDPEAPVRRAATFGAGLSGDARLLRFLVAALGDPDVETAANAAEALGKIGGKDATDALLAALAKPAGPRAASALALFRRPEARTVAALLAVSAEDSSAPELRRAVVYALSRKPQREAAPALRAVLRKGEGTDEPSSGEIAWAAWGLGLLEDEESASDLVHLAASRDVSVSVQALTALNSLSKKSALSRGDELTRSARDVALVRANDPFPGVAIAGLRLLGALPDSPASRATLEENLLRKGWRGQTALVSLTRLDVTLFPEAALKRLDAAAASDSLELRLGAVESLEFLEGGSAAKAQVATALLSDRAARVRAAALGAAAGSFRPIRVATRLSTEDYERVARAANESFLEAEIATARGAFRMELLAEDAPLTVESFRALAAKYFFDGMVIHRVVPDFVVQTGDPRGDGSGGPLYAIRDEINPALCTRGAVAMALSGADTGGSQWFVALSSQLHLDGGYTVFGRVLEGWDVLDRIEQDDRLVSVRVTSRPREVRPPGAVP